MIKALLCDIDGTLLDSNWLHARAWQDAFAEIDIHLDLEEVRRQIGKGADQLIPVFLPKAQPPVLAKLLAAYRQLVFKQRYLGEVKPFPRVREFIARLKDAGIAVALASSANPDELEIYKSIAGIGDLIDEQSSSGDADKSKPHPDIFQAALARLGVGPTDAIALGDTPYDAEGARRAGVRTIGVTTGGWERDDLSSAGCIEVYRDVGELLDRFEASALTTA